MTQYYILSISGSSSMFLTSIFAQYLGTNDKPKVSADGNCHDQGSGEWTATEYIELIGDYWVDRRYTKPLLYAHYTDLAHVKSILPDVKVILVDFDEDDIWQISYMRTIKAHHIQWNQEEYNKLAGPDWPPYSKNNIIESEFVRNELTKLQTKFTQTWLSGIDRKLVDYSVKFKTIIRGDLNQAVANIVAQPLNPELQTFIDEYQSRNKKLYG